MRKGTLRRHRAIGVAALLSLAGLVIAACAPETEDAAPVYLMGTVAPDEFGKVSPVMRQSVAAPPVEPVVTEPTPLAPSMTASAAAGQPASDVISLDDPPAARKPNPNPALLAANPAPMSARFMPPPALPAAMPASAPAPIAAPNAETPTIAAALPPPAAVTPLPAALAPPQPLPASLAPPRSEPSAAELARAQPAPAPSAQPAPPMAPPAMAVAALPAVPQPAVAIQPMRGDIATTGVVVSARDERTTRSRPRYYYAP